MKCVGAGGRVLLSEVLHGSDFVYGIFWLSEFFHFREMFGKTSRGDKSRGSHYLRSQRNANHVKRNTSNQVETSFMRATFSLVCFFALSLSALAQNPYQGTARKHLSIGGFGSPLFRSEAGDLTGDLNPDILFQSGFQAVLVYGPENHSSLTAHPDTIYSFAIHPEGSPTGSDSLFFTSNGGLYHSYLSYPSGTFTSKLVTADSNWQQARPILVAEQNGAETDLVAIDSSRLQVLRMSDALGTAVQPLPVIFWSPVLDVEVLNWDEVAPIDFAVLNAIGVWVFDFDGNLLSFIPESISSARITRVEEPGSTDRLAAVAKPTSQPTQWLFVYDKTGTGGATTREALALQSSSIVGIDAGDANGDGYDDLVLQWQDSFVAPLSLNERGSGGTPPLTFPVIAEVDLDTSGAPLNSQSGKPVFFDSDLDGDQDLLIPSPASGELVLAKNNTVTVDGNAVGVAEAKYEIFDCLLGTGQLDLTLVPPSNPHPGLDHLEVVVWRDPSYPSAIEQLAVSRTMIPFSTFPTTVTFPVLELWDSDAVYSYELRIVAVDTISQNLTKSGGTTIFAHSLSLDNTGLLLAGGNSPVIYSTVLDPITCRERGSGSGMTPLNENQAPDSDPPNPNNP